MLLVVGHPEEKETETQDCDDLSTEIESVYSEAVQSQTNYSMAVVVLEVVFGKSQVWSGTYFPRFPEVLLENLH